MANRLDKHLADKKYIEKIAFLNSIYEEPKFKAEKEAKVKASEFLEGKHHENQGYVNDLDGGRHYGGHVYTLGKETEENLAFANSPEFHMITRAAELKENEVKEKLNEDFN